MSLAGADWTFRGFLDDAWRGHLEDAGERGWAAATVPGSVQHDLWRHGLVPDPYRGRNSLALEWVPERHWIYRKRVFVPADRRGSRARLVFEGLDYAARVFLNGDPLGCHRSQFVPARFEVEGRLRYGDWNDVAVVLEPAPPLDSQTGRTSRVREHRARMNQGWDFCPRMPHLGIWDEPFLEFTGPLRLEDVHVRTHLSPGEDHARLVVAVTVSTTDARDASVDLTIRRKGAAVARGRARRAIEAGAHELRIEASLDRPHLWWPNGHGEAALYEATVRVEEEVGGASDVRTVPFGVRRLEWAPNETPDASARPYTVVVNGRKIYLKGWNWLPVDLLYGVPRPEKTEDILSHAQRANANLLRVWGGGLIERTTFYDACDRLGIMVWQEFVQSSSAADRTPPEDDAYVGRMVGEAEGIVPRLRNHPSLVLWCGGNELEDADFLPLDEDAPVLAALEGVVRRLDPDRLWLHTSASGPMPFCGIRTATNAPHTMHDVHGPWHHQGLRGQSTLFDRSRSLLHSEFGAEAIADLATLEAVLPSEERSAGPPGGPTWDHLGGAHWLSLDGWREAFGSIADLPTLVRASQMLQAEGVRYAVEANRRRRFENSGSLPWTLNEPYPMAAGTAAIGYDVRPRPLYRAIARAYAPLSVTASFDAMVWPDEPTFHARVWLDHEGRGSLEGVLTVRLVGSGGRIHAERSTELALGADRVREAAPFRAALADVEHVFFLDLYLEHAAGVARNRYPFTRAADLAPLLAVPATSLQAEWDEGCLTLTNRGDHVALFTSVDEPRPFGRAASVILGDDHACLFPGERRTVTAVVDGPASEPVRLTAAGWNTNTATVWAGA